MRDTIEAQSLPDLLDILIDVQHKTYDELEKATGISHSTFWRWRNNERVPEPKQLDKFALYLGVTRSWLYGISYGIDMSIDRSRTIAQISAMLEQADEDTQQVVADMVRGLVIARKKKA